MDPAALAGLCSVLASGGALRGLPAGVACPPAAVATRTPTSPETMSFLADALKAPAAREGIARVAYAEAGNQGDSGLAAVVYAILNRLADGRWGFSVDAVLNGRGQFEPVMRAGGDWRSLATVSAPQQARIDTILNLVLDGRLPDMTNGARYFQNPGIVAQRARDGTVSARLVNFGGATPSAIIGAHSFYVDGARGMGLGGRPARSAPHAPETGLFVPGGRPEGEGARQTPATAQDAGAEDAVAPAGDPSQALFVGRDGVVRDGPH